MPSEPSPLVGRASVLTAIGRGAREGRGVLVTGAAGSGGTRLLADALAAARRSGLRAASLRPAPAHERGRIGPFLPLVDRGTTAALPTDDDGAALRAATLALELHAVFVDDPHLLDEATGSLVVDLARAGTAVVANTTGGKGLPAVLEPLVVEGLVERLALDPLTLDEITELAGNALGDPVDSRLALALFTASDGRPARLHELLDDSIGVRSIVHADGYWRLAAPLPAARSVRTEVIDAFSALPPEHRGWIAALAQARSLADDVAQRIAAPETIAATADPRWSVRAPGTTRIASAQVGTAVLGSLDLRARIAVLRRLVAAAEAIERRLTDAERVALTRWRIELGVEPDPHEALALARQPGIDPEDEEALLRAAVDGGAPAQAALADLLRRTRRTQEALAVIDGALDSASLAERVALVRVRSMATGVIERRSAKALELLDAAFVGGLTPDPDLLAVRSSMLLMEGRPAEAIEVAATVLAADHASGFATAFALLQTALAERETGRLAPALDAARRLAEVEHVDRAFADGAALARWLPSELLVAVAAEPCAAAASLQAEHDAMPPEHRSTRRPPVSYTLAGVALLRGDPARAVSLLRDADCGSGAWREGWQPRILAELANAQALAGATEEAQTTWDRLARLVCPPIHAPRVELAAAQLAFLRGDADRARTITAAVEERGRVAGLALDAFDGAFAGIRYGDDDAPARLLALGDRPEGAGRDAQRRYAAALVGRDAVAVDAAAAGLWDVGLRLHAIEAGLRAAALSATDTAPRLVAWLTRVPSLRLPGIGDRRVAGLTAREREVALLAAQGASDRSISIELGITVRTAQTHLGRALGKLGVHRRTELSGLVIEP